MTSPASVAFYRRSLWVSQSKRSGYEQDSRLFSFSPQRSATRSYWCRHSLQRTCVATVKNVNSLLSEPLCVENAGRLDVFSEAETQCGPAKQDRYRVIGKTTWGMNGGCLCFPLTLVESFHRLKLVKNYGADKGSRQLVALLRSCQTYSARIKICSPMNLRTHSCPSALSHFTFALVRVLVRCSFLLLNAYSLR